MSKTKAENMARLQQEYREKIHPKLMKDLGLKNTMAVLDWKRSC